MTRRHRSLQYDKGTYVCAALLAVTFCSLAICIAAFLVYSISGNAGSGTSPAALLGFLGHSLPAFPKTDLVYEQLPTDSEGIADIVSELSYNCFHTSEEDQPQNLVKPQLYR